MWTAPEDKPRPCPSMFGYESAKGSPKSKEQHLNDIISLTGPLKGRVLDLGSGTIIADTYAPFGCEYTVVDFNEWVCGHIEKVEPEARVICKDALEFLRNNKERFDITLCFGLLEYLPPSALNTLFKRAPSDVLCVGMSAAESYLQYPGRLTIYVREDVDRVAIRHEWKWVKELLMPSHVWARFEK